ncbi:MAG TPA: DNA double-strand break repair nuclease NurA [Ktedonobacteraceae bacterium]|nr:DNA double-strand break repair nuclease NurA [Ktedonobacteraceae bacterium]
MTSFTELIAESIRQRRADFLAKLSSEPENETETLLARGTQAHWHPFGADDGLDAFHHTQRVAAVDGSLAIRALSVGAYWIVAQALLIGPDGLRLSRGDTRLIRGEVERPNVDRCASLLMRSLELELALEFTRNTSDHVLLLDGSLYSDLPYLLYNLAIGGYEDLPSQVLEQYLELFDLCQQRNIFLLGVSKSARSAVFGRALLAESNASSSSRSMQTDSTHMLKADVQNPDDDSAGDTLHFPQRHSHTRQEVNELPTDGELLYRWTKGMGLTDPVLLGSDSFGRGSAPVIAILSAQNQPLAQEAGFSPLQQQMIEQLHHAPAIGTFYARLAPGEDVLRIDALASTYGRANVRLLDFAQAFIPHTTAYPIMHRLLREYGGRSVYNAALYVVDHEVRLRAETVDSIYLPVLRRQLNYPIQYDRSTRRFIH